MKVKLERDAISKKKKQMKFDTLPPVKKIKVQQIQISSYLQTKATATA